MLHVLIFGALFVVTQCMWIVNPGPKYPPTKGEVWPKPQYEEKETNYLTFNPNEFNVIVTNHTCDIVENALMRYAHINRRLYSIVQKSRRARREREHAANASTSGARAPDDAYLGELRELRVRLTSPCEHYPQLGMNETYELRVAAVSELEGASVWGVLRGLETFSQELYLSDRYDEVRVNATRVRDWPRHEHRGLLVDTSRHFLSVRGLLRALDAMSYNKLNVLHWHIVDDQSFPYQSQRFPDLSGMGAYHESAVYSPADVQRVVRYARDRGIRVLPEFDVPGHTRSWGVAYPSLLTQCYTGHTYVGLGPMDPTNTHVYDMLKDLFVELHQVFPEKYFHVGGDEVDLNCWASNPQIEDYMLLNNISSTQKLHALFMNNTLPLLAAGTTPVVWQEVFDEKVPLPNGTIVQVWLNTTPLHLANIISSGHRLLYSSCWYLDHLTSGGDWEQYYECDPRAYLDDPALEANIIGGEACMWGEVVDDTNLATRVWPRAAAVAERLWSAAGGQAKDARNRLEEHACRLLRRDIPAQPPNGPGFCLT